VADRDQIPDVQHIADWMADELTEVTKSTGARERR
jgi:hypothetical protein